MFCPNCGKEEQMPDTYCRNCGIFLTNFSGSASLIDRVFGANTPDRRINISLMFDVLTLLLSALLLVFLFGYFDGRFARTGETTPSIIYLVYLFLGLVFVWQFLSLIVGISHKNKLNNRKADAVRENAESEENSVLSESKKPFLPPAEMESIILPSITEDTTKNLDKVLRK